MNLQTPGARLVYAPKPNVYLILFESKFRGESIELTIGNAYPQAGGGFMVRAFDNPCYPFAREPNTDYMVKRAEHIARHFYAKRRMNDMSLYVFDWHGTLVPDPVRGRKFDYRDYAFLPGRRERLEGLRAAGHTLAIASNQGGMSFGVLTPAEFQQMIVFNYFGFDIIEYCPHHPQGKKSLYPQWAVECECRKPKPRMIEQCVLIAGVNITDTVMVGDRAEDRECAESAGVGFILADEFFGGYA